jgi:hypothetical protein
MLSDAKKPIMLSVIVLSVVAPINMPDTAKKIFYQTKKFKEEKPMCVCVCVLIDHELSLT